MGFPNTIRPGFDFDEAILMAEFSQRAYRVFEAADDRDPGDVYRILYRDGWQYLHGFVNATMGVRCFVARHGSSNQYVVVFRGSAYTTEGIEWTNMSSNVDDAMVPYEHRTGRFNSARAQLRVHRGGWNAFVVLRTEIESSLRY